LGGKRKTLDHYAVTRAKTQEHCRKACILRMKRIHYEGRGGRADKLGPFFVFYKKMSKWFL